MRHLKSLRDFIVELESIGDLQRISTEVDLDLEIGAICRRCYETGAAAPLFENIKGVEKGFRVLGAPGGVNARIKLKSPNWLWEGLCGPPHKISSVAPDVMWRWGRGFALGCT
jgi:3-polyprenyl-4-hydroxybenzoate decarboxylase